MSFHPTDPPQIHVPTFYQKPCTHDKGQTITIKLGVEGYPKPTVKWTKESVDGVLSDTYRFDSSERHATLIIENASRADTGFYRLQAVNSLGEDQADIRIIVNGKFIANNQKNMFFISIKFSSVFLLFS